jgi:3-deoxy-7-phosphoheptulonate synthase
VKPPHSLAEPTLYAECMNSPQVQKTRGRVETPMTLEWPDLVAAQQPPWPDPVELEESVAKLRKMPPLVFAGECDQLTDRLAAAGRGEAFVLTGGDCAETFEANTADSIRARLQTVLQMSVILTYGASLPVVKMGRLAGQYFKPRSKTIEVRDGIEMTSYLGDAVNSLEFEAGARRPDPERLLRAYHASGSALNLVRAFTMGGFADLRQVHAWNQDFVRDSLAGQRYELMARDIDKALSFMHACGADPDEFQRVEFYAAHEALSMDYERALTRIDSRTGNAYDVSGHFLWIGERTRQLDGAHIHFASTISNPIGMKVGPTASPEDIVEAARILNPNNIPGRLSLITRMGADLVREKLPDIVAKVDASGIPVVWVCDPMHGNTRETANGYKTRLFDDVITEVEGYFAVHREAGTFPGGIHIELTGDDVTECVGGTAGVAEGDLSQRYETACDPRLNREQSLELAFLVADMLSKR